MQRLAGVFWNCDCHKTVILICSVISEPARAPTRVRVHSLSASEVEVTWRNLPWSTSRRRVLGYEVFVKRNNSCEKPDVALWHISSSVEL